MIHGADVAFAQQSYVAFESLRIYKCDGERLGDNNLPQAHPVFVEIEKAPASRVDLGARTFDLNQHTGLGKV